MPAKIVRQTQTGGYAQDRDGKWWILNPQAGWLRVSGQSRAFRYYLCADTKARILARRSAQK